MVKFYKYLFKGETRVNVNEKIKVLMIDDGIMLNSVAR